MTDFVGRGSVVRRIWGDGDMVLLVFAGSAAEFALNRAVDWLFFTGELPRDPMGRLFSTAAYSQQIVFADAATASHTLDHIRAVHEAVERQRGQRIPDWAHRDVLYMLIDYSERAHELLARPLTPGEQRELYDVFHRVGTGLGIPALPRTYTDWTVDRERHLRRDLHNGAGTQALYARYRQHLGPWRYWLLLRLQALITPAHVRGLLRLKAAERLRPLARLYPLLVRAGFRSIIHWLLMPAEHLAAVRRLDQPAGSHPSVRSRATTGGRVAGLARRIAGAGLSALTLWAGAAGGAAAQDRGFLDAGAMYVGAGVSGIATSALDDRLAAHDYPTFGRTAVALNIGAYGVLPGGVTLGGEWHGLIIGDGVHEGRDVGIGGGYGTLGIGYLVQLSPRVRMYPRIGIGGGGMGLWFESDSVVSFDDVLADPEPAPPREPVLSTGTAVIDLGVGAEFLPGGRARGLMVGLRLGYLAASSDSDWQLYDREVSGGPAASIAGPYIRVVLGPGWGR